MIFTEYVMLIEEVKALLVEADTIDWDPNATLPYKGVQGINRERSALGRSIDRDEYDPNTLRTARMNAVRPKTGDIVLVQDQSGKQTPGVITSVTGENATIVNNNKGLNATRPIEGLRMAPAALSAGIQKGAQGAGRTVWMYSA